MHLLLAKNSQWVSHLHEEVQNQLSKTAKAQKDLSLVELDDHIDLKAQPLAFALATLPHCHSLPQDSIAQQAQAITKLMEEALENKACKLHIFSLTQKYGVMTSGRAQLLKDKLIKELKKKSFHPRLNGLNAEAPLVQVLIWPDRSLRVSILNSHEVQQYLALLSPFPGGHTTIEDDLKAPSRAFKKLIESQKVLGRSICAEEKVLDLGASPGGWSYVALQQGAHVTALDRSPLEDELMQNPKLTFIKGDAFRFESNEKFDWVISDIISAPERVIELIEKWVIEKAIPQFIFTIKFKGSENYDVLQKIKASLKDHKNTVIFRQLNVNKNEVMVMGRQD